MAFHGGFKLSWTQKPGGTVIFAGRQRLELRHGAVTKPGRRRRNDLISRDNGIDRLPACFGNEEIHGDVGDDDMPTLIFVAVPAGDKSVTGSEFGTNNDTQDRTAGVVVSVTNDGADTIIDIGGGTDALDAFPGRDFRYPPGVSSFLAVNMRSFGLDGRASVLVQGPALRGRPASRLPWFAA